MSVSTLNNSIISYCEFFDKLCKQPSNIDIQVSLESVKKYYNKYKTNDGMGKLWSKGHKTVYTIIL